jgi:hypothetical protein
MTSDQVKKAVENLIKLYAEQNNIEIKAKEKATIK